MSFVKREGVLHQDSTDSSVDGLVSLDSEISLHSPAGSPGVFAFPVGVSVDISSVACQENSVVQVLAAFGVREDTFGVELEDEGIGFDTDGDWLFCDC